eukprot:351073-Chlamydomonas_euryale.AAC.4
MGSAGPVGPLFNPLDLSFRQTGGAGVLYWGGSLFALSEVQAGRGGEGNVWRCLPRKARGGGTKGMCGGVDRGTRAGGA